MTGAERIAAERQRQIDDEGYDAIHDEGMAENLAMAGCIYAMTPLRRDMMLFQDADGRAPVGWPYHSSHWKPSDKLGVAGRIRDLEKAGALIAAAIDDLSRDL